MAKKHPNFILAMDNDYFQRNCYVNGKTIFNQGLTEYSFDTWCADVQKHLVIRERNVLEQETNYRQILPYIIVRQVNAAGVVQYHTYRRTSSVGETRLAGNVSIGYGGHIDLVDVVSTADSVILLINTIETAIRRELSEELKISAESKSSALDSITIKFSDKFILDDTNAVGKVHVGIIIEVDIPADVILESNEDQLVSLPNMSAEELLSLDLPLENWTRIYLESLNPKPVIEPNIGGYAEGSYLSEPFTIDPSVIKVSQVAPSSQITSTVFATAREGVWQGPILTVTDNGEFQWAENAEERMDKDDYAGLESMYYILRQLWKTNKPIC